MLATEPCLYVFMGLIASGKSTLAMKWAEQQQLAYFNSDVVRKELAGQFTGSGAEFGQGIYTPEFSRRTYDELMVRAATELNQDRSLVLDGSYHSRDERQRLLSFCAEHGCACSFILCFCSPEETRRRLDVRAQDPDAVSDGTWEIFQHQQQVFDYPDELSSHHFIALETCHPPDQLLAELKTRFS